MELEVIERLANEAGIGNLKNPPVLAHLENGMIGWKRPPGLTYFGNSVVSFANLIEKHLAHQDPVNED